jgi:hypothetical protein
LFPADARGPSRRAVPQGEGWPGIVCIFTTRIIIVTIAVLVAINLVAVLIAINVVVTAQDPTAAAARLKTPKEGSTKGRKRERREKKTSTPRNKVASHKRQPLHQNLKRI